MGISISVLSILQSSFASSLPPTALQPTHSPSQPISPPFTSNRFHLIPIVNIHINLQSHLLSFHQVTMHFLTTLTLATSLLTLASAAPSLQERTSPQCPGQSHLKPEHGCASGFLGCIPYDKASEVCNGPKRFHNDCSAFAGAGSFHRCQSDGVVTFVGCTTNPNICAVSAPTAGEQPKKPAEPVTPPATEGTTGSSPSAPPASAASSCPPGTWYAKKGECPSGFVGCTSQSPEVCDKGPQRFWGTCPLEHGIYYVCNNGFVGCTTNTRVCG